MFIDKATGRQYPKHVEEKNMAGNENHFEESEDASRTPSRKIQMVDEELEFFGAGEIAPIYNIADEGGFAVAHIRPISGVDEFNDGLGYICCCWRICTCDSGQYSIYARRMESQFDLWSSIQSRGKQLLRSHKSIRGLKLYVQGLRSRGLGKEKCTTDCRSFGMQSLQILHNTPEKTHRNFWYWFEKVQVIVDHLKKQDRFKEIKVSLRGMLLGPALIERLIQDMMKTLWEL